MPKLPNVPASAVSEPSARRPIAARDTGWARSMAASLARAGASPNAISVASVAFALLGAWGMLMVSPWGYLLGVAGIQLRLVCNLLDGMVAIEGGRKSAVGELYNEVPDRVADSVLLVAMGYASGFAWVGWAAALVAALTAYIRVFGGALRQKQSFRGPMAKQHRMATLSGALFVAFCVSFVPLPPLSLGAAALAWPQAALLLAGLIVVAGSALTCWLRLKGIAHGLREEEAAKAEAA